MTRKFEYTDSTGIVREDEAYVVSDHTVVQAPNAPVITRGDGTLDPSLIPTSGVKAASLVVLREASEQIFRGDLVRSDGAGTIALADPSGTVSQASVLGIALSDIALGGTGEILVLGVVNDSIFSVFNVNDILFLDTSGGVTNTRPSKPDSTYMVVIGKALGGNEILVQVERPLALGE